MTRPSHRKPACKIQQNNTGGLQQLSVRYSCLAFIKDGRCSHFSVVFSPVRVGNTGAFLGVEKVSPKTPIKGGN